MWLILALVIHLAPTGKDTNPGTAEAPIATLSAAHKIADKANEDIEIRVAPGLYRGQSVIWTRTTPGHSIRLVGSESVFDGEGRGLTLMTVTAKGPTRITVEGLTVQHYGTAISFNADRNDPSDSNGQNTIINNRFIDNGRGSTAVVRFVNSSRNVVRGNVFKGMVTESCRQLHALYFAHHSSHNVVEGNTFEDGCGDPVRFRDASNDNIVRGNTFAKVGASAIVSEWFCAGSTACTKKTPECPSKNNSVEGNTLQQTYAGKNLRDVDRIKRAAPAGCP